MTTTMTRGTKTVDRKKTNPTETGDAGFLARFRAPYKVGQGRFTRGIATWCSVGFIVWAAFDLWTYLQGFEMLRRPIMPDLVARIPLLNIPLGWSLPLVIVLGAAAWMWVVGFLKRPWLADLLIETEGEMKKVSWPALDEAWAATKVVTVTVMLFTLILMMFDEVIGFLMKLIFGFRI